LFGKAGIVVILNAYPVANIVLLVEQF